MSTKAISLKLPIELHERLKAEAEAAGTTVTALLIEGVSGSTEPDPRVAELEATLATVTKERDEWRNRAKAIVDAKAGVPVPRVDAVATKTIGHHAAGPILEPRLNVQGTARPFFRPGTNADKAAKSG